jgi:hypothetical protein
MAVDITCVNNIGDKPTLGASVVWRFVRQLFDHDNDCVAA